LSTQTESFLGSTASSSAFLGNGRVFFGSEDADSVLLGWSNASAIRKSQTKHIADGTGCPSEDDQSEDDAYEDDLYSSAPDTTATDRQNLPANSSAAGLGNLRVHDKLFSPGPIKDIVLGENSAPSSKHDTELGNISSELELVAAQGSDKGGALVIMKREIAPCLISSMATDSADSLWTASLEANEPKSHDYVILSKQESTDKEETEVFILEEELKPFTAPEFNPNHDLTIEIGTLASKNRLIQVLRSEVRSYDAGKCL
jgi:cleavage and polyadenylation specificity factor subunit 1